MKGAVLLGVIVLLTGCITPASASFHTVGRGKYDTSEKRAVWGRALEQFQEYNAIVTLVDYEAGILASGSQPAGNVPCHGVVNSCAAVMGWQFTMADDGTALLSVRRGIIGFTYGVGALLADEDKNKLDAETAAILTVIVGQRGSVAPVRARRPEQLLPLGATCSEHRQCATGQCTGMTCTEE
jgi:hypothetical protein